MKYIQALRFRACRPGGADIPSAAQVYLLTDRAGNGVAVFKPDDEERVPEEGRKWALVNGQGLFRERAAFLVSRRLLGTGYTPNPEP